jgi:hypothetical protein
MLMPLDTLLNQDIHQSTKKLNLLSMAIFTHSVADDGLILMTMPKKAAHYYKCICDPIAGILPTPESILQDMSTVITALQVI